AQTYLDWTAKALRQRGVEVEGVLRRGLPAREIVRYAREEGADIIAISTHGRSGLGRLVFGSVADQVLRESGRPILLIRPET
ncbi:MAG: universal stress protein, partial [Chloroflexi bacterium]|nr:universal stress protein [Chloroflexota bacterium]